MARVSPQDYPRVQKENDKFNACLDEACLTPHTYKIPVKKLKSIILDAIQSANRKSSREILSVPENATEDEAKRIYKKEGKELFKYFVKYYDDPASAAYQCLGKHFSEIAQEQLRNRILQKQRMNSGWRYQFIAQESARQSKRFISVSGIGTAEADFNAQIKQIEPRKKPVNIYVSVKNRSNTLGGQDWPKAIQALEQVARNDRNRDGPYICVFGIAMEKGLQRIKTIQKTKVPHSPNTEVWLSDFFWPFFVNYSYEEIILAVLHTLREQTSPDPVPVNISFPEELMATFGEYCKEYKLLDSEGRFNDANRLVAVFCGQAKK
ncbi:MAG: hypothetical protein HY666_04665 [Chloroflexi bacterium]|nr:hypothetical protein [Chloroflexota bacterium]